MKQLDYKLRTAILLFSAIPFCLFAFRPSRNIPAVGWNSPVPILVELQGDVPAPGFYLVDEDKTEVSKVLAAAGWAGTLTGSLESCKLTCGQCVTLRSRQGNHVITISRMPAAALLSVGQKLDVNAASVNDLLLIPKMRASMAESIVKRREGKAWASVEELQEIRGIGPKTSRAFARYLQVMPTQEGPH